MHSLTHWKPTAPAFTDRQEAGQLLGRALVKKYGKKLQKALLLGCARGGMVVADAVRREMAHLHPALDVITVRKIAAPFDAEYGIGSITQTGEVLFNEEALRQFSIDRNSPEVQEEIQQQQAELQRRLHAYRDGHEAIKHHGQVVVIIDDGLAGGGTARAAIQSLQNTQRIIVAVPVTSRGSHHAFCQKVHLHPEEDFCCLTYATHARGKEYWSIDDFYANFDPVTDATVQNIMRSCT